MQYKLIVCIKCVVLPHIPPILQFCNSRRRESEEETEISVRTTESMAGIRIRFLLNTIQNRNGGTTGNVLSELMPGLPAGNASHVQKHWYFSPEADVDLKFCSYPPYFGVILCGMNAARTSSK
jgi:hypothetical protein